LAVTDVDISPDYVEGARERAAAAGVDATFREGDTRDREVTGRFDLVSNLWTSFGYYDADTDRAILAGLRDRVDQGRARDGPGQQ
jgi:hypothetical protein